VTARAPPASRNTGTSTTGVSSGPSSDTGFTSDSSPTTSEVPPSKVFESETYAFEYPLAWRILQRAAQDPRAVEVALVGPGNQTDAVTMEVLKERPFETKQEVQQHVAQLREDVTGSESGRLIEGPTAFWDGKKNFAGFYVSYRGRGPFGDKLVRQVAQLYFGGRLYRFSCQFVPSHGPAMDEGCKHALETLEIEGLDEIPQ
jgi:hypothetical protein